MFEWATTLYSAFVSLCAGAAVADYVRYLLPFVLLYLLHLAFIVLPQREEALRHKRLMSSVRIGDRIVTTSGLRGQILQKTTDSVIIALHNGALAEIDLQGIRDVLSRNS